MIRLRLFHRQDPANQIDSRVLDEGEISIGRGVKADWQVSDPERDMSRLHLTLAVRGGMITIRDTSANGVFIGTPRTRLEADRAVPVSRGESIVFGPYLLVAEEDAAARVDEAPILAHDPFTGASQAGDDAPAARVRDPFGSALRPDPIKLDEKPGEVDAWERRREYKAGDWDPVAPHRRPDHAQLIGTPQGWAVPPAAAQREHGLGFDAPFTSPILREPEANGAEAVAIPSDWDVATGKPDVVGPGGQGAADAGADDGGSMTAEVPDPILPAPAAPAPEMSREAARSLSPDAVPAAASAILQEPRSEDAAAMVSIAPPPDAADPILVQATPILAPSPAPSPAATPASKGEDADLLFASFCAGARLSPDAFAGEDRAALMERLGAVYRQAILGVADLMSERTALKNDFRMVRTTIRPDGNNPFKWVPPQRIAIELLRTEDGTGYTTGERALSEALHDVKAHMLCVLAGMRGAIGATFDLLSPAQIEAQTANRGFVMPGQRNAAAWSEYTEQFAAQRREADDSVDGPINRAFRQSYEDQLAQLDGQARGHDQGRGQPGRRGAR